MRANSLVEQLANLATGYTPDLERERQEPTYYGYPVLKAPVWRWEPSTGNTRLPSCIP